MTSFNAAKDLTVLNLQSDVQYWKQKYGDDSFISYLQYRDRTSRAGRELTSFELRYMEVLFDDCLMNRFWYCIKQTTSVEDYVRDWRQMKVWVELAYEETFSESLLLEWFLDGLDNVIRNGVQLSSPKCVNQAILLAMEKEIEVEAQVFGEMSQSVDATPKLLDEIPQLVDASPKLEYTSLIAESTDLKMDEAVCDFQSHSKLRNSKLLKTHTKDEQSTAAVVVRYDTSTIKFRVQNNFIIDPGGFPNDIIVSGMSYLNILHNIHGFDLIVDMIRGVQLDYFNYEGDEPYKVKTGFSSVINSRKSNMIHVEYIVQYLKTNKIGLRHQDSIANMAVVIHESIHYESSSCADLSRSLHFSFNHNENYMHNISVYSVYFHEVLSAFDVTINPGGKKLMLYHLKDSKKCWLVVSLWCYNENVVVSMDLQVEEFLSLENFQPKIVEAATDYKCVYEEHVSKMIEFQLGCLNVTVEFIEFQYQVRGRENYHFLWEATIMINIRKIICSAGQSSFEILTIDGIGTSYSRLGYAILYQVNKLLIAISRANKYWNLYSWLAKQNSGCESSSARWELITFRLLLRESADKVSTRTIITLVMKSVTALYERSWDWSNNIGIGTFNVYHAVWKMAMSEKEEIRGDINAKSCKHMWIPFDPGGRAMMDIFIQNGYIKAAEYGHYCFICFRAECCLLESFSSEKINQFCNCIASLAFAYSFLVSKSSSYRVEDFSESVKCNIQNISKGTDMDKFSHGCNRGVLLNMLFAGNMDQEFKFYHRSIVKGTCRLFKLSTSVLRFNHTSTASNYYPWGQGCFQAVGNVTNLVQPSYLYINMGHHMSPTNRRAFHIAKPNAQDQERELCMCIYKVTI